MENGNTQLKVQLNNPPYRFETGNTRITVAIASNHPNLMFDTTELIFGVNAGPWNVDQVIELTARSDKQPLDYTATVTLTVINIDADSAFFNLSQAIPLSVVNTDLALLGLSDISLEEGSSKLISLSLSALPTTGQRVPLVPVSNSPNRLTFMPTTLTFTQENRFMQTLTVSSSIDLLSAGDQPFILSFQDIENQLVTPATATITLTDNGQTPGFVIADANTRLREDNNLILIFGETYPLTVRLQGQTNAAVVLNINVAHPEQIKVTTTQFTFGPDTWDIPQTFAVTALAEQTLLTPSTFSLSVDTRVSDAQFADVPAETLKVVFEPPPQLIVSPINPVLMENGNTQLKVRLNHPPNRFETSNTRVSVAIASNHPNLMPSTTNLVFNTDARLWNVDQAIELTVRSDKQLSDYTATVTLTVVNIDADSAFFNLSQMILLSVVNTDLTLLGLSTASLVEGSSVRFSLTLSAPPTTDQRISLEPISNPPGQLTFIPEVITFTQENRTTKDLTVLASIDLLTSKAVTVQLSFNENPTDNGLVSPVPTTIRIIRNIELPRSHYSTR